MTKGRCHNSASRVIRKALVVYLSVMLAIMPMGSSGIVVAQSDNPGGSPISLCSRDGKSLRVVAGPEECQKNEFFLQIPSLQQFQRVDNALTLLQEEVKERFAAEAEGNVLKILAILVDAIMTIIGIVTNAVSFGSDGLLIVLLEIAVGHIVGVAIAAAQNTGIDIDLSNLISLIDEVELALAENDEFALLLLRDSLIEAAKDIDLDGVPNNEDDCPFVPGSAKLNGCPF